MSQIASAAGMQFLRADILEHFQLNMAPTISLRQGITDSALMPSMHTKAPVCSLDAFGEEMLECCQGLSVHKVIFQLSVHNYKYIIKYVYS